MIQRTLTWILILTISLISLSTAEPKKCYKCDSGSDANCISGFTNLTPADCAETDKFCYTAVDNDGKVTRGCRADDCNASGTCAACEADGCNKHSICQTCDSSTDLSCITLASANAKFNKVCPTADTKCLAKINDDKHTIRGCATQDDLGTCPTATNPCKLFDVGANSNIGLFPADRRDCHQCTDDKEECAKAQETSKSTPCALFVANDKCFMFAEDEKKITRGCVSDTSDKNKCKSDKPDDKCYICEKSKCNEFAYKRDQSLKCVQCTSTETDKKCISEQSPSDAKNCKNQIIYNAQEKCYTQQQKGIVDRGCFYDREEGKGECTSETHCETCTSGDACNAKAVDIEFTCIQCRSDQNPNCYDNPSAITGEKCKSTTKPEKDECFHGIWSGVVIRGCLVDADERVQGQCKDTTRKQCVTCEAKDCNDKKTSGAASLSIMAVSATVLLAYLVQLF